MEFSMYLREAFGSFAVRFTFIFSESLFASEAVARRCSVKKVFLEISQHSQGNTCARVSFSIKLQACNFIGKETLAQVFFCGCCKISKNTYSYKTPPVAASIACL